MELISIKKKRGKVVISANKKTNQGFCWHGAGQGFPGNPAWEGCSPILSVNALVPIVLAPGAHVCLQIIFLLKAKEQKPKKTPPKLENNLIQARLQEIQHSQLYHSKTHEDKGQLHVLYIEKKNKFSSRELKQHH